MKLILALLDLLFPIDAPPRPTGEDYYLWPARGKKHDA